MIGGPRIGAVAFAAVSAAGVAREVVTHHETTILNVPLSMLLVAMAGTMIGFVLLPARDAARLSFHGRDWRQNLAYLAMTAIPLVLAVVCYSFVAAWVIQITVGVVRTITRLTVEQSLVIPATGLAGVGIRLWLPGLLAAVQRRADRVIGGEP